MSTCIFCQNNANSKEHVWPDWLKNHLPRLGIERKHQASMNRWDDELKKVVIASYRESTRPGDPHSQKLRIVCSKCNGGWMSKLQSDAKPILAPMIKGEFNSLSSQELKYLSRWAAMFTMVVEFKDKPGVGVSQGERNELKVTQSMPKGWCVSIGRYTGHKWQGAFNHLSLFSYEHLENFSSIDKGHPYKRWGNKPPNAQITTFAVGKVIFNTMSCSNINHEEYIYQEYEEFSKYHGMSIIHGAKTVEYKVPEREIGDAEANLMSNSFVKDALASDILREPT